MKKVIVKLHKAYAPRPWYASFRATIGGRRVRLVTSLYGDTSAVLLAVRDVLKKIYGREKLDIDVR